MKNSKQELKYRISQLRYTWARNLICFVKADTPDTIWWAKGLMEQSEHEIDRLEFELADLG